MSALCSWIVFAAPKCQKKVIAGLRIALRQKSKNDAEYMYIFIILFQHK